MADLNQFEIQRELISIEERLTQVRDSLSNYLSDAQEVKDTDAIIKKVQTLQTKVKRFFA
jgi:hypothetical protein